MTIGLLINSVLLFIFFNKQICKLVKAFDLTTKS